MRIPIIIPIAGRGFINDRENGLGCTYAVSDVSGGSINKSTNPHFVHVGGGHCVGCAFEAFLASIQITPVRPV